MGPPEESAGIFLRQLQQAGQVGSYTWRVPDDRLVLAPGLARLLELDGEEQPGRAFLDRILADDRPGFEAALLTAIRDRSETYSRSFRVVVRGQGTRCFFDRGAVERDGLGRPATLRGTMIDVTDFVPPGATSARDEGDRDRPQTTRRQREAALAMSEARYRGLVALIPAAIYTCDAAGRITFFNDQAVAIWGSAPQPGERHDGFLERFHPRGADGTRLAIAETPVALALRMGKSLRSEEMSIERPDGTRVTLAVNVDPLPEQGGAVDGAVAVFVDISEHKQALEKLRESEETLRAFTLASSDSIFRMNEDWSELRWLQGRSFLADSPQPLRGWLEAYVPASEHARVKAAIAQALQNKSVFDLEHQVIRADRSIGWTHARAIPTFDRDGEIAEWLGAASDMTTRKETEIALRESEARFRALADMASDWYWEQDENFRFVELSSVVEELAGSSPASHIGKTRWELPHTGISDEEWRQHRAVLERHEPFRHLEYRRVNERGETIWMSANGDPIFDADGRFKGYRGTGSNITARKEAEAALHAAYVTFRQLVERSPFGIYVVDADFRLVQISQGAQKVFENVQPLMGRDFEEILHAIWTEPFASEAVQRFRHTLATGEAYHSPSMVERRADVAATESYDWKIERISLPDGRFGVVCHFYDLSERLRYEEHIKLLMREINHRSKNLLSLIQAIARQTASTGSADFMERFSQRVHSLAAAQDLLVSNDWRSVPIADLVRSQLSHFADLIDRRIVIRGPRLALTPAGTQALGLVLNELATNAAKYGALSKEDGRIMVEWSVEENGPGDAAMFWISWLERGGPPVLEPKTLGFGHTVITSIARLSVDGEVFVDYAREGLCWRLECLAPNLVSGPNAPRMSAFAAQEAPPAR